MFGYRGLGAQEVSPGVNPPLCIRVFLVFKVRVILVLTVLTKTSPQRCAPGADGYGYRALPRTAGLCLSW